MVAGTGRRPPRTVEQLERGARLTVAVLWTLAVAAGLAAGSEAWRYGLLVLGRTRALPVDLVTASDVLVVTCSVIALAGLVVALATMLWWLLAARERAAVAANRSPARRDWTAVLAVLVPGWNLFLAGCVLAELEHAVLRPASTARPRPSRLVRLWWLGWVTSETLAIITMCWGASDEVWARADGVLWHAATDLAAVAAAVLTALVVRSLTRAIVGVPRGSGRRWRVVRVIDAPESPPRSTRPAGAAR